MPDWRDNLIEDPREIAEVLRGAHRLAVVGIKTDQQGGQPAYYVPEYMQRAGFEVIPVPVYYPEVTEILGQKVYRTVAEIPEPVDLVILFRRGKDVSAHLPDLLEASPKAAWMQAGIRNDEAARQLAEAGIKVVQDRCAMVEHRRMR